MEEYTKYSTHKSNVEKQQKIAKKVLTGAGKAVNIVFAAADAAGFRNRKAAG